VEATVIEPAEGDGGTVDGDAGVLELVVPIVEVETNEVPLYESSVPVV